MKDEFKNFSNVGTFVVKYKNIKLSFVAYIQAFNASTDTDTLNATSNRYKYSSAVSSLPLSSYVVYDESCLLPCIAVKQL